MYQEIKKKFWNSKVQFEFDEAAKYMDSIIFALDFTESSQPLQRNFSSSIYKSWFGKYRDPRQFRRFSEQLLFVPVEIKGIYLQRWLNEFWIDHKWPYKLQFVLLLFTNQFSKSTISDFSDSLKLKINPFVKLIIKDTWTCQQVQKDCNEFRNSNCHKIGFEGEIDMHEMLVSEIDRFRDACDFRE